jgi:hypothetical protein
MRIVLYLSGVSTRYIGCVLLHLVSTASSFSPSQIEAKILNLEPIYRIVHPKVDKQCRYLEQPKVG